MPSPPIDHGRARSATLVGAMLGTAGLLVDLSAAGAGGIEVLKSGQLKFGVTTAEDELLSDGAFNMPFDE